MEFQDGPENEKITSFLAHLSRCLAYAVKLRIFPQKCCCIHKCFLIEMQNLFFKTASLFVSIIFSGTELCKLLQSFMIKVLCSLLTASNLVLFSSTECPFLSQIACEVNWNCLSRDCLGRKVQEELFGFYKSCENSC